LEKFPDAEKTIKAAEAIEADSLIISDLKQSLVVS